MKTIICPLFVIVFSCCMGYAQTTIVFQDDFEDGNVSDWDHEDGWQIVLEGTNHVFEGIGHKWATPPLEFLSNATFEADFKLVQGAYHFNILFRSGRYFFPIHPTFVQFIADTTEVDARNMNIAEGVWHRVKATLRDQHMQFFLDGSLIFEYNDPVRPILMGKPAFEGGDHIFIDNVFASGEAPILDIAWHQTNGPVGGNVWTFVVNRDDPTTILAGIDHGGIRRTVDGGQTWETITSNRGLNKVVVFSLIASPNNPDILYAGVRGAPPGVFKTIDGGDSWFESANGIAPEAQRIKAFGIAQSNTNVLYAGTESHGIFKTSNSGDNWGVANNGFPTPLPPIYRIAIDPQDENVAYAALGRLYKTINGGDSWLQITGAGLPENSVFDVDIDVSNGKIIYAIVNEKPAIPEATAIYKSEDGGQNWKRSVTGIDSLVFGDGSFFHQVDHIEASRTRTGVVYAISTLGIFKSSDFAANWHPIVRNRPEFGIPNGLDEDPVDPNVIYYGPENNTALLKADNAKREIQSISNSFVGLTSGDVLIDPANPNTIYSGMGWEINGTGLPLQKSTDGGETWFSLSGKIGEHNVPPHGVVAMAMDPADPRTIYFGTNTAGILKTENGGETFQFKNTGLTSFGISALTIDEAQPDILYAGTSQMISLDRGNIFNGESAASHGIFKSEDAGATWRAINNGLQSLDIAEVVIDPLDPQTLYSCVYGEGIYKSTNAGESWQKFDLGVPEPLFMFTLAVSPSDPQVIFAAENDVPFGEAPRSELFFKSTDGGISWQVFDFYGSVEVIWIDPQNSNTILVGSHGGGVFYSTDGAETFTLANNGLIGPEHMYVFDIVTNPTEDLFYVGGCGRGVYKGVFDQTDLTLPGISIAEGIEGGTFNNGTTVNLRGITEPNLHVYTREPQSGRVTFARSDQQGNFSFPFLTYNQGLNEMAFSVTDSGGNTSNLSISFTVTPATGVEESENSDIPKDFVLSNNYPNPFNPMTIIKYQLPISTKVTLSIYNIFGQLVHTL
ncbi:MAG: hypothetical protein ACE5I1_14630, partial [bacterium]